jgi:hypothetical protein
MPLNDCSLINQTLKFYTLIIYFRGAYTKHDYFARERERETSNQSKHENMRHIKHVLSSANVSQ